MHELLHISEKSSTFVLDFALGTSVMLVCADIND